MTGALERRLVEVENRLRLLEDEVFGGNAYAVSNFDRIAQAIRDRFSLTRAQSMLLRHLLLSGGVSDIGVLDEIVEANGGHGRGSSEKQAAQRVYYHICKIRGIVGLYGVMIERVREGGYRLSRADKARLMRVAGISRN